MPLDSTPVPPFTSAHVGVETLPLTLLHDRLPARRLIAGGGSHMTYPRLQPGDVSLDVKVDAAPDVYGSVSAMPLRSCSFASVVFQWLDADAFANDDSAVREAYRLLQPGGTLVIETSARLAGPEFCTMLSAAGFGNIQVDHAKPPAPLHHVKLAATKPPILEREGLL